MFLMKTSKPSNRNVSQTIAGNPAHVAPLRMSILGRLQRSWMDSVELPDLRSECWVWAVSNRAVQTKVFPVCGAFRYFDIGFRRNSKFSTRGTAHGSQTQWQSAWWSFLGVRSPLHVACSKPWKIRTGEEPGKLAGNQAGFESCLTGRVPLDPCLVSGGMLSKSTPPCRTFQFQQNCFTGIFPTSSGGSVAHCTLQGNGKSPPVAAGARDERPLKRQLYFSIAF